jgi:hypothetical protein
LAKDEVKFIVDFYGGVILSGVVILIILDGGIRLGIGGLMMRFGMRGVAGQRP